MKNMHVNLRFVPKRKNPAIMTIVINDHKIIFKTIELHASTSSTQKLKLMGRGGQFTYIPTLPLTWRLPQASHVE